MARIVDTSPEATIRRMKAIHEYFGRQPDGDLKPAKDFAQEAGLGITTWNNFVKRGRPGVDNAVLLIKKYPVLTLDWIYLGDPDGIKFSVAQELTAIAASFAGAPVSQPPTTRRAGRRAARSPSKISSRKSRA